MKKKKVLVAMSGGVDSSAAASLLKDQGYDVIGVTMQVWDYTQNTCSLEEGNGTCCSSEDVEDARAVADHLGIPFYVINCEAKFKDFVIKDFVDSYLQGKTPIPCANCNTYLKFDHLIEKMKELECDYLATGHYAITVEENGKHFIHTSNDQKKDQTYFLFTLNSQVIPKLLFPLGSWTKPEVRAYSEQKNIPVAQKKDSTGICFVGKNSYVDFINTQITEDQKTPGVLKLYPSGEVLGKHTGIHQFTFGQRKHLGISYTHPLYVKSIDPKSGDVWLGQEDCLFSKKMSIQPINFMDEVEPGEKFKIKVRFHHQGALAKLKTKTKDSWEFEFEDPQRSITPGQAAVLYKEARLLGGGWIL